MPTGEFLRAVAQTVADVHASRVKYEPGLDSLPQLEDEIRALHERVNFNEERVERCDRALKELRQRRDAVARTTERVKKLAVEHPGQSGNVRGEIQRLERELELLAGAVAEWERLRAQSDGIAKSTRKLADEWPQWDTLKRLRAMDADVNGTRPPALSQLSRQLTAE